MTHYQYWLGQVLLLILGALIDNVKTRAVKDSLLRHAERLDSELQTMVRK